MSLLPGQSLKAIERIPITKLSANYLAMAPGSIPVVLVTTGAFAPIHKMHTQMLVNAKAAVEAKYPNRVVLAG